jgi:hypothetical protein
VAEYPYTRERRMQGCVRSLCKYIEFSSQVTLMCTVTTRDGCRCGTNQMRPRTSFLPFHIGKDGTTQQHVPCLEMRPML